MKKLDGLFDIVVDKRMLMVGYEQTQSGPRKQRPSAIAFKLVRFSRLKRLHESLRAQTYRPSEYVCFKVYEPKVRDVAAPATVDKVIQYSAHIVLEAAFHDVMIPTAYACRASGDRKRKYEEVFTACGVHALHKRPYGLYGQHEAATWLRDTMREMPGGWMVTIDCRKFFYSIDRELLKKLLRKRVADERFLWLLDTIIDSSPTGARGIPLGSATSQNFANIYLNELDQYSVRFLKVRKFMRYQDDIFAAFPTREGAKGFLGLAKAFLAERLHLQINESKTKISPVKNGVTGLGYVIKPTHTLLKDQITQRFKRKKKRMMARLAALPQARRARYRDEALRPVFGSFLGVLRWCNGYHLARKLLGGLNYVKVEDKNHRYGHPRPRKERR